MTQSSLLRPLVTAFMATALFAGPPYLTDDPEPVNTHRWETYLFMQGVVSHGTRSGLLPAYEANYGPFTNAQLQFQIPVAFERRPDGSRDQGLYPLRWPSWRAGTVPGRCPGARA